MAIYYLLHNFNWGSELSNGSRNARTFLIGSILYSLLYTFITYWIRTQSDLYESLRLFLTMAFMADLLTMAYIYRNHYGRTILNELGDNDEKWDYNESNDRYQKKQPEPIQLPTPHFGQPYDFGALSRQTQAVIKIQRWWRRMNRVQSK